MCSDISIDTQACLDEIQTDYRAVQSITANGVALLFRDLSSNISSLRSESQGLQNNLQILTRTRERLSHQLTAFEAAVRDWFIGASPPKGTSRFFSFNRVQAAHAILYFDMIAGSNAYESDDNGAQMQSMGNKGTSGTLTPHEPLTLPTSPVLQLPLVMLQDQVPQPPYITDGHPTYRPPTYRKN